MDKRKSHAFKKDIYLLGADSCGNKYWLEAPSWDCKWYWGFGYIETYTNSDNPSISNDIISHQHWCNHMQDLKTEPWLIGYQEVKHENMAPWDSKTEDGKPYYFFHKEYVHNPYDNLYLVEKTFNKEEGWELGELFAQFYFLQQAAEMFKRGNAYVASTSINTWKDPVKVKEINEVLIPMVTKRILEILTPEK